LGILLREWLATFKALKNNDRRGEIRTGSEKEGQVSQIGFACDACGHLCDEQDLSVFPLRWAPLGGKSKEFGRFHFKNGRKSADDVNARCVNGAFKGAYIGSVDLSPMGKLFL